MRIAAHSPAFAQKVGVPQSVAQEFYKMDKQKALADLLRRKK
jgi:hypothetical protein